jgi:hypothetical protein
MKTSTRARVESADPKAECRAGLFEEALPDAENPLRLVVHAKAHPAFEDIPKDGAAVLVLPRPRRARAQFDQPHVERV